MTRLALSLLVSTLLACGYYGPPVRERPLSSLRSDATHAPAPALNSCPSGECGTPGR